MRWHQCLFVLALALPGCSCKPSDWRFEVLAHGNGTIQGPAGVCDEAAWWCDWRFPLEVESVSVTAIPAPGWRFEGWSEFEGLGCGGSSTTPCTGGKSPVVTFRQHDLIEQCIAEFKQLDMGASSDGSIRDGTGKADLHPLDLGTPDAAPADIGASDLSVDVPDAAPEELGPPTD